MSSNRLSIQSIVTLPPYHISPLPSETLIAREGERGGVDTVVEYPEDGYQTEERREEEMQTIFEIREARRREQNERAARRAERAAAVAEKNWRRVRQMDAETRARLRSIDQSPAASFNRDRNHSSTGLETGLGELQPDSALLIVQLQAIRDRNSRSKRIGSVSYAELGVARHDGTRIRGDSVDSDHRPLLDSASSIGRGRRGDHSRASSILSTTEPSRSRATLQISQDERPDSAISLYSHNGSGYLTPQSTSGDLPPEPPSYDDDLDVHGGDAPAYQSPILARGPQFPAVLHRDRHEAGNRLMPSGPETIDAASSPSQGKQPFSSTFELPQLQLNTRTNILPPAIQVVQATPVTQFPASPPPLDRVSMAGL